MNKYGNLESDKEIKKAFLYEQEELRKLRKEALIRLQKDSVKYDTNHERMGQCLILDSGKYETTNKGVSMDAQLLKEAFEKLKFDVDITQLNIEDDIKLKASARNAVVEKSKDGKYEHTKADCFVLVLLIPKVRLPKKLTELTEEILEPLKGFKELAGKPKLVFIQASEEEHWNEDNLQPDSIPTPARIDKKKPKERLPKESNFMYIFSTPEGQQAYRDRDKGSWFVQALCTVLKKQMKNMKYIKS